jgi:hypothetical protein
MQVVCPIADIARLFLEVSTISQRGDMFGSARFQIASKHKLGARSAHERR